MAEIYHDRYTRTAIANVPGSNTQYGHQCTPLLAGDVLLGMSAYLYLPGGEKRPVATEIIDSPTWGTANVAVATYGWDDGAGGAGAPGTAYLTGIFAKAVQL